MIIMLIDLCIENDNYDAIQPINFTFERIMDLLYSAKLYNNEKVINFLQNKKLITLECMYSSQSFNDISDNLFGDIFYDL
jgi:hypothetical protein